MQINQISFTISSIIQPFNQTLILSHCSKLLAHINHHLSRRSLFAHCSIIIHHAFRTAWRHSAPVFGMITAGLKHARTTNNPVMAALFSTYFRFSVFDKPFIVDARFVHLSIHRFIIKIILSSATSVKPCAKPLTARLCRLLLQHNDVT